MGFETKDSGKRDEFPTGMVRDTQEDKPRYDLLDRAFLKRWAELMARGAKKYGENNWRKAATQEELTRFRSSAVRHMFQYLEGDISEDHAVAVAFNLAGAEMVEAKLKEGTLIPGKAQEGRLDMVEEKLLSDSGHSLSPVDFDETKACCGDCIDDSTCMCTVGCLGL